VPTTCVQTNDSYQANGLKSVQNVSNLPRHILQRKQVENLNKKKLNDIKDKENNLI